jgi:hypothetical protein
MKIDIRRAAIERDINAIREALGESALRLEQAADADDPAALAEAQARLAQVQAELTGTEQKLVAHDAALEARAREDERRSSVEAEAEVQEILERIADLHRASTSRAGRLMRTIEAIGPLWAELLVELGELHALTNSAVHKRGGTQALRLVAHLDGHDLLAGAVGPAIASTGLGVTGPSLSPFVITSPLSGAFQPVTLAPALERLQERRLDVIERAATFARGGQELAA